MLESKHAKQAIKFLIVSVILFFFVRYIYIHWTSVSQYQWKFNYPLLSVSLILVIANFMFLVWIWKKLILRMGYFLEFRKAFKIFFYSTMGKYVPGKVWAVLGAVYLCEKEGIPPKASGTAAVLFQALNMIAGLLLVMLVSGTQFLGSVPKVVYLPLVLILIVLIYPPLMEKVLNILLRLLKREPVRIKLSFRYNLGFTLLFLLSWCVYGAAFNVFVRSLTPYSWDLMLFIVSAFAISYVIGFLSVFVPGGLGVREGILVFYLSQYFPLPVATLIALLSRLWMTAAEILGLAVSLKL